MELKEGDLSKILIFVFILIVGLMGTYLEFRKPSKKEEDKNYKKEDLNKTILESLKKEENDNSNI
ncbi:hypothetical protein [Nitrosophilus kaiyonis]|uniref:hypothetical protein n=1 Tax=Nitrosophilus kaiyonis TaxID=2930200 RepID=UPI0024934D63|nr:hypothetical protein [Nitrosophilus kaiyonis]